MVKPQLVLANIIFVITIPAYSLTPPTLAQIQPDSSLGNNNSVVNDVQLDNGNVRTEIGGGLVIQDNLLHSFERFSIDPSQAVYFKATNGIESIVTRITGNDASVISGVLGVTGNADLFLINPNGIIFGQNASLDLDGSFFAATAESVEFSNGFDFSTTSPNTPALLTIGVPIGLQYGSTPGSITNLSQVGLSVKPKRVLGLIGGDIIFDQGRLDAPNAQIEIGAVASGESVNLAENEQLWTVEYQEQSTFNDIILSNRAVISTSSDGGGDIHIQGRNVIFSKQSQVTTTTSGEGQGGNLRIVASGLLQLDGDVDDETYSTAILAESQGSGQGGDINIRATQLEVLGAARISTQVQGSGNGGDINIRTTNGIDLEGTIPTLGFTPFTGITSDTLGSGDGGNIQIFTDVLTSNGARITSQSFFPQGVGGDTGNLVIEATEQIILDASPDDSQFIPALIATNAVSQKGNAGNITVDTGQLLMRDGAQVSTSTFLPNSGNAGNISIEALDLIEVDGVAPNGIFTTGIFAAAAPNATGNSGTLTIDTGQLKVNAGARVAVETLTGASGSSGRLIIEASESVAVSNGTLSSQSLGTGNAGNLEIITPFLKVDQQGELRANTTAGGGNIIITSSDIRFRNQSTLTTDATGESAGGNIRIQTDTLVALENSDITATAQQSSGGQIVIDAQGVFGTEIRGDITEESDITAFSELGAEFSGTVEILTPDVDPAQGLVQLPENVVDVAALIEQGCAVANASSFVVTGSGGLPPNPGDTLSSDSLWVDLGEQLPSSVMAQFLPPQAVIADSDSSLIEAQGWVKGDNGNIVLTASPQQVNPQQAWQPTYDCPATAS